MDCPYCGTRNRARAEFCRHCRALLPQPAEASRWSIIGHARGRAALVLLVVAVGAAFLLGRQVATLVGAPAAAATATPTPPGSHQQAAPVTRLPAPTATPPPTPTRMPQTTTPVAGPASPRQVDATRSPVRRHARPALAQVHRAPSPSPTAPPSPS